MINKMFLMPQNINGINNLTQRKNGLGDMTFKCTMRGSWDIFNILCVFTNEPIREQGIK